ncbi:MAG: DUF5050 domain-containing protein [Clostridia bacterium]|nr:DUF5050 domain-containing protein [Clostridia bacterium]
MSELLSGTCPGCGQPLAYTSGKNDETIECPSCGRLVVAAELMSSNPASSESAQRTKVNAIASAIMGFDNPESGVVFIENFFDNYDWADYQKHADVYIDELDEVVENNKMKNGAVPTAWYLDYKSVAVPVRKKIEGLAELSKQIGEKYAPDAEMDMFQIYDSYGNICKALTAEKETLFKRLDNSVKYAEKFALDKTRLSEIKADLTALKALFDKEVKEVDDISKMPAYIAAQTAYDKVKSKEFAENGIDAKSVYEEALEQFNGENPNKRTALSLFEDVRGYKDSVKYIDLINQYFSFNSELYRCFGKHFIFKKETYTSTLDVSALKKKKGAAPAEAQQSASALSLYEIVNGEPEKEPIVKGITQMIACYGSKLYYFKENQGICSFDVFNKLESTIDEGKMAEYRINGDLKCAVVNKGRSFYVQKFYSKKIAASGCGAKKQPAATETVTENPYSIIVVDMVHNTSTTVVPRLTEMVEIFEDSLFYTFLDKEITTTKGSGCGAKATTTTTPKIVFMVCDLVTGENKQVLDQDCMIHGVYDGKVVYSQYEPNALNQDLYVYDLATDESKLIEKNIYNFFTLKKDKIYYLVGNEEYCPLIRNSFDGSAREEIMQNVEEIINVIGDWLYVKKGRKGSLNSAIVKVSGDGKKRVLLCTQYKSNAEIQGNFVYYVDIFNALRCVRIDGKKNIRIAKDVYRVWSTTDCLYYVRYEQVGEKEKALSLYKMDKEGHNVRKLSFNVQAVTYDKLNKTLYFKKKESAIFKAYKPHHEKEAVQQVYELDKFYTMDMNTEETKLVLTLGLPHANEVKSGCGGKKTDIDMVYEEVPFTRSYELERRKAEIKEEEKKQDETTVVPAANAGCGSTPAKQPAKKGAGSGCGA